MGRHTAISKLRGSRSFRRRPGQKSPRSITLIVCEGETEQEYFEAARVHYELATTEVVIAEDTIGAAPISVVQSAEVKCAQPGGYDKVFCVFDRDGHESFDRARERIRTLAGRKRNALPIQEAISIPCFELWILLHFERTDAPFERCTDVIRKIRDSHVPAYAKADAAVARQLMVRLDTAIGNSKWLEDRAVNNNYNPYSSVFRVLQHLAVAANQEEDS